MLTGSSPEDVDHGGGALVGDGVELLGPKEDGEEAYGVICDVGEALVRSGYIGAVPCGDDAWLELKRAAASLGARR
jgi:hypothetical protein